MNAQDDLQPQIRRAIDDEVASVRLKSVEVVPPTRTTTVATAGLMPGFAWLVAVVVVAAIVGAIWREDGGQRVAGPPTSVDSSAAASASVGAVTSPTLSSTPGPSGASPSPACGAVEVGEITVCPGAGPVGTRVRIEGRNCADPGAYVQFVLIGNRGETDGTVGSYSLATVVPDGAGRFAIEFTVPAGLEAVHGE